MLDCTRLLSLAVQCMARVPSLSTAVHLFCLQGAVVLVSAPAGPLTEGHLSPDDTPHTTYSYSPHPAAVAAAVRAQRWLASSSAGPLGEGQESPGDDDDNDQFTNEPHPAAAAARPRRWPASSAEAAGGRAFQVRASFEEELQRELSGEGQQLEAESASRQMSMQQHGSDAAIGAIISIHGGSTDAASASAASRVGRLSGASIVTGIAGDTGGGSVTSVSAQQQRHIMPGTSVQWVPGAGVVPADREDAAAAATLGVPIRSRRSSSTLSSSGNTAAPAPAAADPAAAAGTVADPREPEAAVADDVVAAEHSSTSSTSAAADTAAGAGRASEQQQGSPQAGPVKELWDTALMSYLQRDTALLEGITGGDT
jgi:hypothetical protein